MIWETSISKCIDLSNDLGDELKFEFQNVFNFEPKVKMLNCTSALFFRFQENSTHENSTHENSTHENSTHENSTHENSTQQ